MEIINPITWLPGMLTNSSVAETDFAAWNSSTSYSVGTKCILASTHRIYECLQSHQSTSGASATVTISAASPGVVTWNAHGLANNTPIMFSTTGVLPAGISPGVRYYVVAAAANTFSIATTPNGYSINTTLAGTGVHTASANSTSPDLNSSLSTSLWLDLGATNRYKFADDKWGTQTTDTNNLVLTLYPNRSEIDSIALLNLIGSSVIVTSTRPGEGEIYSKTVSLQTDIGVYDWKTYFTAPIVTQDDIALTDVPSYGDQTITITITGASGTTRAIGGLALGKYVKLGSLQTSPKVGIIDYSQKTTDIYGNIVVTKRAYSKRISGTIAVNNNFVDQLASLLASIRSTPVVWIGAGNDYSSLIVWGFFKDFEVDIANPILSYCSITIEGLV